MRRWIIGAAVAATALTPGSAWATGLTLDPVPESVMLSSTKATNVLLVATNRSDTPLCDVSLSSIGLDGVGLSLQIRRSKLKLLPPRKRHVWRIQIGAPRAPLQLEKLTLVARYRDSDGPAVAHTSIDLKAPVATEASRIATLQANAALQPLHGGKSVRFHLILTNKSWLVLRTDSLKARGSASLTFEGLDHRPVVLPGRTAVIRGRVRAEEGVEPGHHEVLFHAVVRPNSDEPIDLVAAQDFEIGVEDRDGTNLALVIPLVVAALGFLGTAGAAWWTALREGERTRYANETARNAQFQMAKREVFAAFLAATRAYLDERDSSERRAEYRKQHGRVMTYTQPGARGDVQEIVGGDLPKEDLDWDRLVNVLIEDVK